MRANANLLLTSALLALAAPALAQDAAPAAATGLEEIVVTAERRETNLQDTPIAVTALTSAAIEARGIRNVNDLAATVPNLTATTGPQGSADANFFIRGVGQFDFIATNDPGVGVYVDGVYLGRTVGALIDAGDIARVEVLRGPQGTLFGRNTLGGAVSITSIAPSTEAFGAQGRFTFGARGRLDADVGVNAALSDSAALRLYAFTRYQNGFATNETTGARFGATKRMGGKAQLLLKPTDALTVTIAADFSDDRSNPAPSVLKAIVPLPFFPIPAAFAQVQDPKNFYRNFASNSPRSKNDIWGVSGTVAYDFGGATLKSITAYRELDSFSTSDPDGTSFRLYDQQTPTKQHEFSQEVQLSGDALDDKLSYLIGGYYFHERVRQTLFLCFAPITPVPTAPFNDCNTWTQGNDQRTRSYAVFGQARYRFTDALSLTLGGRYTWEEKDNISNQSFDFRPAGASAFAVSPMGFGFTFLPVGARTVLPIAVNLPGDLSFKRFTPKVGVEFAASDDIFVFASWSRGFRSGGFNGRLIRPQPTIPTYAPDSVDNYELGLKSDLFDRRLRVNITGFFTKYQDIQQTISDPAVQFRVANAGEADLYGFDAELTAAPADGLRLNLGIGYTNSEFKNVPANVGPINGNRLPFSPEWTVAAGAEYELKTARAGSFTPRVDYRFQSRTFFTAFNNDFAATPMAPPVPDDGTGEQQKPYGLLSARLTWNDPSDRFSLAVYGDNLTDEEYFTFGQNALQAQGVSYLYLGRPREWGVTLGARF